MGRSVRRRIRWIALFAFTGSTTLLVASYSSGQPEKKDATAAPAAAAKTPLEAEYERLAQVLNSGSTWDRREAAKTLLLVRPGDVADAEVRKSIARGYRALASDDFTMKKEAVTGLVVWGGAYSVPVLIDLMGKETNRVSEEIFDGLAALKDPRGAEAVAKHLGNFFNHDAAVRALGKMGSAAEDALIKAAPSNNPKVSLAAMKLLNDIGSAKSLDILDKAAQSRNPEIRQASRDATATIRKRQKSGESVDKPLDPESPFAPRTGPPIDILALKNARNAPAATSATVSRSAAPAPKKERPLVKGDWSVVKELKDSPPRGFAQLPVDPLSEGARPGFGSGSASPPGRSGRGRSGSSRRVASVGTGRNSSIDWNQEFKPVRLADRAGASERPTAMEVAGLTEPVAVVVHRAASKAVRLECVRLREGRLFGSVDIEDDFRSLALSPAGTRLLVLNERSGFNLHRCEVYDLSGDKPTLMESWSPYAKDEKFAFAEDTEWAAWIDEEYFLTLSARGVIVLWQAEGRKAIYQIDDHWARGVMLTPGRNYFAIIGAFGVTAIHSSRDGELVAKPTNELWKTTRPLFSPNGQYIASFYGRGTLRVWDVAKESVVYVVPFPNETVGQLANWLDDTWLWAGKGELIDPARKSFVWRYTYSAKPIVSSWLGPWHWMLLDEKVGLMLVPVRLPHAAAEAAAKSIDPSSLLLLRPGTQVSFDMQDVQNKAEVEANVTQALEKNGLKIAPDQRIRFVAKEKMHESRVQIYKKDPKSTEEEKVQVSGERTLSVVMEIDGKVAWEWSAAVWAPSMAVKGLIFGSLQRDVDRHIRETKYKAFETPMDLLDPKKVAPLGSSYLTAAGVE